MRGKTQPQAKRTTRTSPSAAAKIPLLTAAVLPKRRHSRDWPIPVPVPKAQPPPTAHRAATAGAPTGFLRPRGTPSAGTESLWGCAAAVPHACDLTVAKAPDAEDFRDSRGVARALTGNRDGEVADFQEYVSSTKDEFRKLQSSSRCSGNEGSREKGIRGLRSSRVGCGTPC